MNRLPLIPRLLLRISPAPSENREDVEADLLELFTARKAGRGSMHANWRLYRDVISLWRTHRPAPQARSMNPRSPLALVRDALADLRYAVRLFARQPGVFALAILGLSAGLGIATAGFGIVNAAAIRGDGLADGERVPGVLKTSGTSTSTSWNYDEFLQLREHASRMQVEAVFTNFAKVSQSAGGDEGPAAAIAFVSGGFFGATGGRTMHGRALEPGDEQRAQRGAPPVVVSYVFWDSVLNRDAGIIGRTIRVGQTDATVVGVAERGFAVPRSPLVWMPLTAYGNVYDSAARSRTPEVGVEIFGRLAPDVSMPEAEAQLSSVAASLPQAGGGPPLAARLATDAGLGRESASNALAITVMVSVVIGLVLLLACANVATLLVSTAITREREMGVRAALGASRRRIVRQLVTESLALGTVAALIGLVFAHWAIPIVGSMIEAPPGVDLAPDLNVYLFLGFVTLVSGVAAGLAPARHGRHGDLLTPLKGESRQNRAGARRMRALLVMTQAAVSVVLIVVATLFVRATFRAAAIDVGFDPTGLYVVTPGSQDGFDREPAALREFWSRAVPALEGVPGIMSVTLAEVTPFGGISRSALTKEEPARMIAFNGTQAGYFDTMGLRLLAGRAYTREEVASRAPVAVVSQSLARTFWPDRSPLGEPLPDRIPTSGARPVVIGIAADVITADLHERNALAVYEPISADAEPWARLMIRVAPGAGGVAEEARQRLRVLDQQSEVTVASVATRLDRQTAQPRLLATLSGLVGIVAVVLCVIGLYGLTASVVGQRAREMAVRAAIGASPRDLLRLLMWQSLTPVLIGLAAGTAIALLAGRLVAASMFFGMSPNDPVALAAAALTLLAAAALAVVVPTRRAASVDAALVLKQS